MTLNICWIHPSKDFFRNSSLKSQGFCNFPYHNQMVHVKKKTLFNVVFRPFRILAPDSSVGRAPGKRFRGMGSSHVWSVFITPIPLHLVPCHFNPCQGKSLGWSSRANWMNMAVRPVQIPLGSSVGRAPA